MTDEENPAMKAWEAEQEKRREVYEAAHDRWQQEADRRGELLHDACWAATLAGEKLSESLSDPHRDPMEDARTAALVSIAHSLAFWQRPTEERPWPSAYGVDV